jgi:hypothetical protein
MKFGDLRGDIAADRLICLFVDKTKKCACHSLLASGQAPQAKDVGANGVMLRDTSHEMSWSTALMESGAETKDNELHAFKTFSS